VVTPFGAREVRATLRRLVPIRTTGFRIGRSRRTIPWATCIRRSTIAAISAIATAAVAVTITIAVTVSIPVAVSAIAPVRALERVTVPTGALVHRTGRPHAIRPAIAASFTDAADFHAEFLNFAAQAFHLEADVTAIPSSRPPATFRTTVPAIAAVTTITAASIIPTSVFTATVIFASIIAAIAHRLRILAGFALHALGFFIQAGGAQMLDRLPQMTETFTGISPGSTTEITGLSGHHVVVVMMALVSVRPAIVPAVG
jgi:hypothetical protein